MTKETPRRSLTTLCQGSPVMERTERPNKTGLTTRYQGNQATSSPQEHEGGTVRLLPPGERNAQLHLLKGEDHRLISRAQENQGGHARAYTLG